MNEYLAFALAMVGIFGGFALVISICVWVSQIYSTRKTLNAVLDHLGFEFYDGESMKKLTKKKEEKKG